MEIICLMWLDESFRGDYCLGEMQFTKLNTAYSFTIVFYVIGMQARGIWKRPEAEKKKPKK